jgi:hypothetical protein
VKTGAYSGRWVAISIARLLAKAALLLNPDIFQKYNMGDISKKVANKLYSPPKNIPKKF